MKRHKAAVFALWKYNQTAEGISAEMVFEALTPYQKACCRMAVNDILAASDENVPGTNSGGKVKPSPPNFVKAVDKHSWDIVDADGD